MQSFLVGTWYILIYGASSFSGVILKAVSISIPKITLHIPVTNLTAGSGEGMLFQLRISFSSFIRLLVIILTGGSGNADLFVNRGVIPKTSFYDWSSKKGNNEDEIRILRPPPGMLYFNFRPIVMRCLTTYYYHETLLYDLNTMSFCWKSSTNFK